jgi:TatA/E family protein of Tat protein translocase
MFGLSFWEVAVILVVLLLVFGPKALPDLAKKLGAAVREFRSATDGFKNAINDEMYRPPPVTPPAPSPQPPAPAAGTEPASPPQRSPRALPSETAAEVDAEIEPASPPAPGPAPAKETLPESGKQS